MEIGDACRHCGELQGIGQAFMELMSKVKRAKPQAAPKDELAWLVERGSPVEYAYMDDMGVHWTSDPNKAMRLARREDAEMFAAGSDDAVRVCEHMWCSPLTTHEKQA